MRILLCISYKVKCSIVYLNGKAPSYFCSNTWFLLWQKLQPWESATLVSGISKISPKGLVHCSRTLDRIGIGKPPLGNSCVAQANGFEGRNERRSWYPHFYKYMLQVRPVPIGKNHDLYFLTSVAFWTKTGGACLEGFGRKSQKTKIDFP